MPEEKFLPGEALSFPAHLWYISTHLILRTYSLDSVRFINTVLAVSLAPLHSLCVIPNHLTTGLIRAYFRMYDSTFSATIEVASIEVIKELVKFNMSVSILAPWAVENEVK